MLELKPIYKPFSSRPKNPDAIKSELAKLAELLRFQTSIVTWLALGGVLQGLAVFLFRRSYYTALIPVLVLMYKLINTALITYHFKANPYTQDAISGRFTSLLPEKETGELVAPANRKIAVLHLGAKSNHPLGPFAPQFKTLGDWLTRMEKQRHAEDSGFMGETVFHRIDHRGAYEVVVLSYWDSIDSLWAFAHSGAHREGWQWWERTVKENGYVGINHEIFEADAKKWETVYMNFQPTMMGATTFLKKNGQLIAGKAPGEEEWVSGLVDAKRGPLARSSVRFGRTEGRKFDESRVAKEIYA